MLLEVLLNVTIFKPQIDTNNESGMEELVAMQLYSDRDYGV